MAQTLTLQGIVRITEIGDYNLVLPNNGISTQVGLPLQNENVYVIIESVILDPPNSINIYLPKISDFNGLWNAKIHFLNKNRGFLRSQITLNSYYDNEVELNSDWINSESQYQIDLSSYPYNFLQITDYNYWGLIGQ
jgi:hypothetical protein